MTVSRYQGVGTAILVSADGDEIPYLRRRFVPDIDLSVPARLHRLEVGELNRPDLIATVELGDAEMSWVLADVNPVLRPSELCKEIGQAIRVPQAFGVTIGQSDVQ
jgi:hypothetical protein